MPPDAEDRVGQERADVAEELVVTEGRANASLGGGVKAVLVG